MMLDESLLICFIFFYIFICIQFENNNQEYPGLIQSYYDMHTVEDVWQQPEAKQLYVSIHT